jgi:carboxyl-terminal processing protease
MIMRLCLCLALAGAATAAAADPVFTAFDLDRARGMLGLARDEVVKEFHDPARVGPEFLARCRAAHEALASAKSNDAALMIVAQPFLDIGDSHTVFLPPPRRDRVDHHWKFHAVGSDVYVSEVDQDSEAAKRGLRVGDKLLNVEGMAPARTNRFLMQYFLYGLAPRAGMRVIAQAPGEEPRELLIPGEVKTGSTIRNLQTEAGIYERMLDGENENKKLRSRFAELPGDILVWKLREFDRDKIPAGLSKIGGAKAVVLDLRGNPGGLVEAVEDMLNGFFTDDFDAFVTKERKKTETTRVKGKGRFKGLLLVLIDHTSASGSEVFARTVQMRQRGVLLGDRTSGALTMARYHLLSLGTDQKFTRFGAMIAFRNFTMADGTVIEGKGVGPDYQLLPTHEQLYRGHDPVLAKALSIAGHKLTPEEAGKLFPPLP